MKRLTLVLVMLFIGIAAFAQYVTTVVDDFTGEQEVHVICESTTGQGYLLYYFRVDVKGKYLGRGRTGALVAQDYTYYDDEAISAMYKFDSGNTVDATWIPSSDGGGAFTKDRFLSELMKPHKLLIVRLYDYQYSAYTYKFDMSNFLKVYHNAYAKYVKSDH